MKRPSALKTPCSVFRGAPGSKRSGFTLIEVVLVMVLLLIISGISVPYFAGTLRGTKLKSAARTIERMSRYGHSMAIMREETLTMVLNPDTMELYMGAEFQTTTNQADGELDQDVLKRLGYVDDARDENGGIDKEIHRFLSDDLVVRDFKKDWSEEDDQYEDLYMIRFFPNGFCEQFEMELEDNRGHGIKLENDPITGKVWSEFLQ